MKRRSLLKTGGLALGASVCGCPALLRAGTRPTDIRIVSATCSYDEYRYRVPMKFANAIMDRATLLTVHCTVRTAAGQEATGFGCIPFNHIFSYPSKTLSGEEKNNAMRALAEEIAKLTAGYPEDGHPIGINQALAPVYLQAAAQVSQRLQLADPIPKLCTLVTASACDAAVHDAFGKVHGVNCFRTYGPEYMKEDLSRWLGADYRGRYPAQFFLPEPKPRMPLGHLVSAIDPLESDGNTRTNPDGFPATLPEWIEHNGLIEFKIKVNGTDLRWDLDRVLAIDRVTQMVQARRDVTSWAYTLDFNEKCPNVDYYLAFLRQLKEENPAAFARIRYVEQPTSRDLRAHPGNRMEEAARLCPTVIDESLTDVDSLLFAREMGWTGAVAKSPKGLTNMLLIASVAAKEKILICGGDMSCPGAALVQTAGFQARVPTITAIEANARQYLPQANEGWEEKFPGLFRVRDGLVRSGELTGPGLGA